MSKSSVVGYSFFPMGRIIHGAHIRPYYICKELGIPLLYRAAGKLPPLRAVGALATRESFLLFPGYNAHQVDLGLTFLTRLRGCRLILDAADIPFMQYYYFNGPPSPKAIRDFTIQVHFSDTLLFPTSYLAQAASELMNLDGKRCEIVENGSDPDHFRFTPLPKENVIFYVGGYIPARGIDELVEAYRILRKRGVECRLMLASIGLPESFRESGVEVWRSTYYDQVPRLFELSYVFVIPHRPNPYMRIVTPLKLFDAMAAGRPVVSTRCEGTAEIIEREKCGIVTGDDPSSLADAIEYLFDKRSKAEEMGRKGRVAVERRYNWKSAAQKIESVMSLYD